MAKNIMICLDGTNNQLRAADNTNVVRLLDALVAMLLMMMIRE